MELNVSEAHSLPRQRVSVAVPVVLSVFWIVLYMILWSKLLARVLTFIVKFPCKKASISIGNIVIIWIF